MSAADLVAQLAAAGTPPELLAAVAQELFAGEIERKALEVRRKHERERKARSRAVTGQGGTDAEVTDKGSLEVSPAPLPKPSKTTPLSPPKSKGVETPDWMPPDEWAAFKEMRRKMRSVPFTETAERGIIGDIARAKAEGHCPAKLLMKAVKNGHRGIFPDETTKAPKGSKVQMTAQQFRERAEWFVKHGQPDKAEEYRQQAIAIENRRAA